MFGEGGVSKDKSGEGDKDKRGINEIIGKRGVKSEKQDCK